MYWSKAEHARAFTRLDAVEQEVRAYLKELLNEYHGQEQPQRYYDILAGYWLQWLAHATIFASAPRAAPPARHRSTVVVPVNADDQQFTSCVLGGGVQDFICSVLDSGSGSVGFEFAAQQATLRYDAPASWFRSLLLRFLARIGNRDGVLVCGPYAKCSRWAWLRFVLRARNLLHWNELQAALAVEVPVDREWRVAKARAVKLVPGDLGAAIKRLMPLLLPVMYVEGLRPLREAARALPIGKPRAFYSANSLYYHPFFKILAAEHQDTSVLLGHQHGGSFGMELRHAPEEYERSTCDVFYTWGWGEGGRNTRTLSPPAFSRHRRRRRWRLLLCLGDFPQVNYRLQFFPAGAAAAESIRGTVEFARAVAQHDRQGQSTLIRPPPGQSGGDWLRTVSEVLPRAGVDAGSKRALERFAQSELVFHNYLSTGWLETIWLDVPTLAIYDPEIYAFREAVQPHIEAFERFGLLHRSGASAAQLYARIRDDVRPWWNQPEFKAARSDFAARYVRVSTHWQRDWMHEFNRVLENHQTIIARRAGDIPAARHAAAEYAGDVRTDLRA